MKFKNFLFLKKVIVVMIVVAVSITAISCKNSEYKEYSVNPVKKVISVEAGGNGFIAIKAEIPSGSHIYANPKGPGIGRATELTVTSLNDSIKFAPTKYEKYEKYTPSDDDKYVNIYHNETIIIY